jgi:hypothetical protein
VHSAESRNEQASMMMTTGAVSACTSSPARLGPAMAMAEELACN